MILFLMAAALIAFGLLLPVVDVTTDPMEFITRSWL